MRFLYSFATAALLAASTPMGAQDAVDPASKLTTALAALADAVPQETDARGRPARDLERAALERSVRPAGIRARRDPLAPPAHQRRRRGAGLHPRRGQRRQHRRPRRERRDHRDPGRRPAPRAGARAGQPAARDRQPALRRFHPAADLRAPPHRAVLDRRRQDSSRRRRPPAVVARRHRRARRGHLRRHQGHLRGGMHDVRRRRATDRSRAATCPTRWACETRAAC